MLLLLLAVHLLLMLLYAIAVVMGYSRMHWLHLLLALMLPFAGEICLLLAEMNPVPAKPLYVSPFTENALQEAAVSGATLPADWRERIHGSEDTARAFLLDMISSRCDDLVPLLYEALQVGSSEVCHIAAATMMKLHHQHEQTIAEAQQRYACQPGNVQYLCAVIDALDTCRVSGLNVGEVLRQIEQEECEAILQYLSLRHEDTVYRQKLISLLTRSDPAQAVQQAQCLMNLAPGDIVTWELALQAHHAAGMEIQVQELLWQMRYHPACCAVDQRGKLEELENTYGAETSCISPAK